MYLCIYLSISLSIYLSELPHHMSWNKHWAVPSPPMVQILFHHYCTHRMALLPIVFSPFKIFNILFDNHSFQRIRRQWAFYYPIPQSFLLIISYFLALQL